MDIALPSDTRQQVESFQRRLNILQDALRPNLQDPSKLTALDRAELHVTLAEGATVLFELYLRAKGSLPEEHSISKEEERLARYKRKLSKVQSETILKTTKRKTEINVGAANRFITAAIPELSSQQKQALREAGVAKQKAPMPNLSKDTKDAALHFLQQTMAEAAQHTG